MEAIRTEPVISPETGTEIERQELDWLLMSGVLGRSGNLARLVKYICEERFAGRSHLIKEYTIATEALGRRADFDPHTDTIVRVTVHSLRKRLKDIYQNEGADRPMRLVVPPGRYDPIFVPAPEPEPRNSALTHQAETFSEIGSSTSVAEEEISQPSPFRRPPSKHFAPWALAAAALCLAIAASAVWVFRSGHSAKEPQAGTVAGVTAATPPPAPQATIRVLMGMGRAPYVDHSGISWGTGNYCQGATSITVPPQKIDGTLDPTLYLGGVRGMVHCVFPVTQKLYEVHFHFAETSDLPAATRVASFSINVGQLTGVDVVNDAGGDGIATSTVVTGVAPESDGAIHIEFTSEVSLLTAVEILPAPSPSQLPIRFVVNAKPFVDKANQLWMSDRYFSGGRFGTPPNSARIGGLGVYESCRIGRFRYNIPVVPLARYRVRLYFREPWFGKENGGQGGPGSRVFDVAANGHLLLNNFDILAESDSAPVVKTFDNVQATPGGRIELSFIPLVNYPVVNAIEVLPMN